MNTHCVVDVTEDISYFLLLINLYLNRSKVLVAIVLGSVILDRLGV